MEEKKNRDDRRLNRILGDEWLDWQGEDDSEATISEGKKTFLVLTLIVLIGFVLLALLFWYLVLPRFELFGRTSAVILTVTIIVLSTFFLVWYIALLITVLSRKNYLSVCLQKGTNLFIILFPFVMKLARYFGISRDRLSHSFIRVSNTLIGATSSEGKILALLPRCLNRDLKREVRSICHEFPDVILHTAPGGNEARKIIRKIKPRAIVAVACERDLVSGIQDIAPKIPIIGIPNSRPAGPCKDTRIELDEFRAALSSFLR
jgi:hypothetical protein